MVNHVSFLVHVWDKSVELSHIYDQALQREVSVLFSVTAQPLISTKYLPELYTVRHFLLSVFEMKNNKLNDSL